MRPGTVYLVGAGCGPADLITVRGLRLLRACDVVVYDNLIAEELLEEVPAEAEKIYVGKRRGRHSAGQEEICNLLVDKARAGKLAVRLKGGDPFVFGRGGEEMEALLAAGIPCEVVPGISSAIAIPAEAGIPVTHRGVSRSVHIITAHTPDTLDGLPEHLEDLARLEGTLVFLMGLSQLPRLVRRLQDAGMDPKTPAAVLSGGNAFHHAAVRGTLDEIAERAGGFKPPAVIVVGAVAALELKVPEDWLLQGVTVGLTGTDAVTKKLRAALAEHGARTFLAERSIVEELPFSMEALCGGPRWLVFTSVNGVEIFFRRLATEGMDLRRFSEARFAVIGAATAAALAKHGIQADLCPEVFTTEALAQALLERVPAGEEICLLRSAKGEMARTLTGRHPVREVPLYDLRADPDTARRAASRLGEMDYLVFSSAGGTELYFAAHGAVPEGAVCVCIGTVTAKALRKRYEKPFLTARETSARGIVEAILEDWAWRGRSGSIKR